MITKESEIIKQEKELIQDTEKLKKLIKQVENSGVAAWETGDLLKLVKGKNGYIIKYQTFEQYTKTELGISPQTANKYIKIREQFTIAEIGNLMLVSHLSVIAEIENDKVRKLVLKNFKEKEEKQNKLSSKKTKSYKTTVNDVIAVVAIIMDSELAKVNSKLIGSVIDVINQKSKAELAQKRAAKKASKGTSQKDLFGDPFTSEFFKDITALIENEPIDEMGVVALFCVMFQSLRGTQFIWENDNVTFVSIKYVRVAFPDACIRCKTVGKTKKNFELKIEFEFESYNYIKHNHNKSEEKCDMIVCWNDNAKTDKKLKDYTTVKSMPPVLSLKECFKTGEIELIK